MKKLICRKAISLGICLVLAVVAGALGGCTGAAAPVPPTAAAGPTSVPGASATSVTTVAPIPTIAPTAPPTAAPTAAVDAGGSWSPAGSLSAARTQHTATFLTSGKVLLTGGQGLTVLESSAELYDPESNTWSPAGSMSTDHERNTATLLPSGKALVAGGVGGETTAELFNP